MEKILVIQTAFLGDIVLATSFLKNLRTLKPQAEIDFLTTPPGAELLLPNPWNVQVIPFSKRGKESGALGLAKKIKELRAREYQMVFNLHRSARSAILAKGAAAGAPIYGFKEAVGSMLFAGAVSRKAALFEAEKNNLLLSFLDPLYVPDAFPTLSVSDEGVDQAKDLVGKFPYMVFAPSSVWATKRWPAKKFGQLAARLSKETGWQAVIVGSNDKDDLQLAEEFVTAFREENFEQVPINLSGKTSLQSLKAVIRGARFAVSNDSSPLHIAVAFSVPTLGVFGPTTRSLGFFPLAPEGKSAVAELSGLSCRPCGKHGHKRCPLGHFRCMLDLSVDAVYEEARKLLCLRT